MKGLTVAEGLTLPLDWVTMSTVVYGARGSGKTTLGRKAAEEAAAKGLRFCAVDLKGDWWGLRASADGQADGLPVVIFGGDHADVPLEVEAGRYIAETVAGLPQSTILDLEHLSKGKQLRFLVGFFERLYDVNRDPLLLLLDEAQRYAPQKPMSPEATQCLGAVEDLVKLGRKHGIGPVVFTQRGSGLNKEVSELCDMLVAFRTPGPLDQSRVRDWLEANVTAEEQKAVMAQIASMETGTAVFASGHPGLKVFTVAKVLRPWTFDSSATPSIGARAKAPKRMAPVELDVIKAQMADAIERADANDPKKLQGRIADLERQLVNLTSTAKAETKTVEVIKQVPVRVNVPVLSRFQLTAVRTMEVQVAEALAPFTGALQEVRDILAQVESIAEPTPEEWVAEHLGHHQPPEHATRLVEDTAPGSSHRPHYRSPRTTQIRPQASAPVQRDLDPIETNPQATNGLKAGARRMLLVLARHYPLQVTRPQWGTLTQMTHTGGTFQTYLGALKKAGYIEEVMGLVRVTDAGFAASGIEKPQPMTTAELLTLWRSVLKAGARAMLDQLVDLRWAGGDGWMSRDDLASAVGMTASGGTFQTYLGKLRTNGLAEVQGQLVRASDTIMGVHG